jgi:hypothetical protein
MKNLNLLEACSIEGDALALRMALASNREAMSKLMPPPKRLSNFVKGKAPMPQDNEGYILYPAGYPESKIRRIHFRKSHSEHNFSFKTFDASYVLTNKSGKVVAKYVGGKHKGSKTCVWVPKVLVSNAKVPKTIWVPKVKN